MANMIFLYFSVLNYRKFFFTFFAKFRALTLLDCLTNSFEALREPSWVLTSKQKIGHELAKLAVNVPASSESLKCEENLFSQSIVHKEMKEKDSAAVSICVL